VLTFVLTLVGWVFFRAADLPQSVHVLGQMFGGSGGRILLEPWHFGLAALALIPVIGGESGSGSSAPSRRPWVYASALAVMLFCLVIFGVLGRSHTVHLPPVSRRPARRCGHRSGSRRACRILHRLACYKGMRHTGSGVECLH
jgi:hypothetical protein